MWRLSKYKRLGILIAGMFFAFLLYGCVVADSLDDSSASNVSESAEEQYDFSSSKVGIFFYDEKDVFISLYKEELLNYLEVNGFANDNISVYDAGSDAITQKKQVEECIEEGVDVIMVNPVNSMVVPSITEAASSKKVPVVYFNREPSGEEEDKWYENDMPATYVGSDGRQAGSFQGELIADIGMEALDMNGNGMVDYVLLEGEIGNIEATFRSIYVTDAMEDAGLKINCLSDHTADWSRAEAKVYMEEDLEAYKDDIELVICNNDDMALGAMEAIEEAGRTVGKDIYLFGIDAVEEALQAIIDGRMTATIFNDFYTQSHHAVEAAMNYIEGNKNEHYIGCDYIKVDKDTAEDIKASINQ